MNCFFDIEYKNWAWGFQHTGTLILSDGSVRKYDLSSLNDSHSDFDTKKKHSKLIGQIELSDMKDLCALLKTINDQPLSQTKDMAFDAGSTNYYGYLWNPNPQGGWKKIQLKQEGDRVKKHQQRNANVLVERLKTVIKYSSIKSFDPIGTIYLSVQPHDSNQSRYAKW